MFLLLFLNYLLIFFNLCSYCTNFKSYSELVILTGIPTKEAKTEMGTHEVMVEAKIIRFLI